MHPCRLASSWFALLCCIAAPVLAQCDPDWAAIAPLPGLTGSGRCSIVWDPDGVGPLPQQLVVGGSNLLGGGMAAASKVVTWDGTQWIGLGTGPGTSFGDVYALAVWNGVLFAGGNFSGSGFVASWNGTTWQPVGTGSATPLAALAVWNNTLVAGGTNTGGTVATLQTWDGVAWTPLPAPPTVTVVSALVAYQGSLVVGGLRPSPFNGVIERWNGSTWASSILATPNGSNGAIRFLVVRPSLAVGGTDTLYVGGLFTSIGGTAAASLAVTSGGAAFAWSPVANNSNTNCTALHVRSFGLTGYSVTAGFQSIVGVYQWSTVTGVWTQLGSPSITSLSSLGGVLHATRIGSTTACSRWSGTSWDTVAGADLSGEVRALARSGDDVVLGGAFLSTTPTALNRIARWNGSVFSPLGTGMTGSSVDALSTASNGDVIAGGLFTAAGGTTANNLARWNGSSWSALGTGTDLQVTALCEMPNGDVIAGGKFTTAGGVACSRIARWNGSAWSPLAFGMNGDVLALAVRADGMLFAAGSFTAAGAATCNRIASWNGAIWQSLGTGCNGDVHALAFRPNGDLVAVGAFTSAGGVAANRCAIWNGTTWSSTGSAGDQNPCRSVGVLPDGDVVAGRGFHQTGAAPDSGIARWNGTTWSGFATGLAAATPGNPVGVRAIVQRRDGTLLVGGDFGIAGGLASDWIATLEPPCRATAATYGAGCSGTAGPITITADTLPWIAAPFRTTTTGVAPNSICLGVIGLAPIAIPLPLLLPEGQPGCSLLASLDIVVFAPNGPGNTATSSFALGNDPALIGVPFFQQTIPFEFDLAGAVVAVRSSDALSLVIGTL